MKSIGGMSVIHRRHVLVNMYAREGRPYAAKLKWRFGMGVIYERKSDFGVLMFMTLMGC